MRVTLLIFLLLGFLGECVATDPVFKQAISVKKVPFSESIFFSYVEIENENVFRTYDSFNNIYLLKNKDELTTIDLNRYRFDKIDASPLPHRVTNMGYSSYHNGYLFWDRSIGRVFLMDSTKSFQRIDSSYETHSQYGHIPWTNPKTGEIFAFGGYGLFNYKSIIVSFNSQTGQWQLVQITEPEKGPAPTLPVLGVLDIDRDHVYIYTTKTTFEDYGLTSIIDPSLAIWRYKISSRNWEKLFELPDGSSITSSLAGISLQSSHPRLPIFLYMLNWKSPNNLCFFHTKLIKQRCTQLLAINTLSNEGFSDIFWSDKDQAYYLVKKTYLNASNQVKVSFLQLKIEDEEAFMAWIEDDQEKFSYDDPFLISGSLLLVAILLWITRRKILNSRMRTNDVTDQRVIIEFTDNQGYVLRSEHNGVIELPKLESKLLSLLLADLSDPDSYVKSDTIDEQLVPHHPSTDYIRRVRNITLEKLESLFQMSSPLPNETYILRRSSNGDKRKNEYRLNDSFISIQ